MDDEPTTKRDEPGQTPGERNGKHSALKDYAKAEEMVQLALAIPIGCLLGWAFGAWLDRHLHTSWISIVGILVGAAGGFVQIFTVAARFLKDKR